MNTRDLEYFAKLVEIKNFSQVADEFSVTQPTITMSLKRLEDHFGIQLIHRDQSHGQLTVTTAGKQLNARAKVIIEQMQLAEAELARTRQSKIKIGLPPILGNNYLPQIASELIKHGLMNNVETVESGSDDLLEQIMSGKLDIALLGSVGPMNETNMDVTQIGSYPFTIVTPPEHRLAQRDHVAFNELGNDSFVLLSAGFVHVKAFEWFKKESQTEPEVIYRTPDVSILKKMITQHVGIGFLTNIAITDKDNLVATRITDVDQPLFTISVVTRKNQILTPEMKIVKEILLQN